MFLVDNSATPELGMNAKPAEAYACGVRDRIRSNVTQASAVARRHLRRHGARIAKGSGAPAACSHTSGKSSVPLRTVMRHLEHRGPLRRPLVRLPRESPSSPRFSMSAPSSADRRRRSAPTARPKARFAQLVAPWNPSRGPVTLVPTPGQGHGPQRRIRTTASSGERDHTSHRVSIDQTRADSPLAQTGTASVARRRLVRRPNGSRARRTAQLPVKSRRARPRGRRLRNSSVFPRALAQQQKRAETTGFQTSLAMPRT